MASDTYNALLKQYRTLAKRADQRLVRLEKQSQVAGYEAITQFAYARAARDIKTWGGNTKGKPRFNTKAPNNTLSLQAKIADIQQFLNAPSSTVGQINRIYAKGAKTTNERYGTDFTWQDLAIYYETVQSKHNEKYGSKTLIKALAIIKHIGPDPEAVKVAKRKTTILSDDAVVNEITHKLLKAGQTSKKLFGQ